MVQMGCSRNSSIFSVHVHCISTMMTTHSIFKFDKIIFFRLRYKLIKYSCGSFYKNLSNISRQTWMMRMYLYPVRRVRIVGKPINIVWLSQVHANSICFEHLCLWWPIGSFCFSPLTIVCQYFVVIKCKFPLII